ncbi:MAG TPA: GNAT family N-acetyltransferase, partial [Candidatus Babeliaceae bacterium]|nr:GNAT family N-acetyltransferase [Candidatus Babeliaceae bacterium]
TKNELEEMLEQIKELGDLNYVTQTYTDNRGAFYTMMLGDTVIGMGAVKYLNTETCELKRMFFSREYRGKGLGSRMINFLLEQAKILGYKSMRLEVDRPEVQEAAVSLYKKVGFCEIAAYKSSRAKLFMEKLL